MSTDTVETSYTEINDTSKLQPMGVGDILDTTFSLYRKHFLLFLGIVSIYFFASLVEYALKGLISNSDAQKLITSLFILPFAILTIGSIVVAAARIHLGGHITSGDALRQALHRFFSMLGGHLLWVSVWVITLILTLISIPAVARSQSFAVVFMIMIIGFPISTYFAVRWGFYIEAILLEKLKVTDAFRRSSQLVRGAWWQVFGTFILILISSYAVQFIFEISLGTIFIFTKFAGDTDLRGIIEWAILDSVLDSRSFVFYATMTCIKLILSSLVLPIWVIGVTILYFDRRVHKESSEVELTANTGEDV